MCSYVSYSLTFLFFCNHRMTALNFNFLTWLVKAYFFKTVSLSKFLKPLLFEHICTASKNLKIFLQAVRTQCFSVPCVLDCPYLYMDCF